MRISIVGDSISAKAIRQLLVMEGLAITDEGPQFIITIGETVRDIPVIDGVDSELERKLINQIAKQADTCIYLQRPGGCQSDQSIEILMPKFEPTDKLCKIEIAIVNAIVQAFKPNPPPVVSVTNQPQIIYLQPSAPVVMEKKPWYKFY